MVKQGWWMARSTLENWHRCHLLPDLWHTLQSRSETPGGKDTIHDPSDFPTCSSVLRATLPCYSWRSSLESSLFEAASLLRFKLLGAGRYLVSLSW